MAILTILLLIGEVWKDNEGIPLPLYPKNGEACPCGSLARSRGAVIDVLARERGRKQFSLLLPWIRCKK